MKAVCRVVAAAMALFVLPFALGEGVKAATVTPADPVGVITIGDGTVGQPSISDIAAAAGVSADLLVELDKVDAPETSSGQLSVTYDAFKPESEGGEEGAIGGTWTQTPTDPLVAFVGVKHDGFYSILDFRGAYGADNVNFGTWTVPEITAAYCAATLCDASSKTGLFEVSNLSTFAVVPLPGAVWLFVSALAALFVTVRPTGAA